MRLLHRRFRGFTMIELLIVIIIIGILMAIGIPAYLTYQSKAKDAVAKADLTTAFKAIAASKTLNNGSFPTQSSMLAQARTDEPGMSFISGIAASAAQGKINVNLTGSTLTLATISKSGKLVQLTAQSSDGFSQPTTSVSTPSTSFSSVAMSNSPIAYWHLAEPSGASGVDAIAARNGTYLNAPTLGQPSLVTGGDTAVTFNGTNQYLNVPYNAAINPTTTFSVAFFAKVSGGAGTYRSPISDDDGVAGSGGWKFYANDTNHWMFRILGGAAGNQNSDAVAAATVTNGQTYFIVGTYDGTTARLYVDGVLAAAIAGPFVSNTTKALTIGANNGPGFYFPGTIDEVSLYSTALGCGTTTVGQSCTGASQIGALNAAR